MKGPPLDPGGGDITRPEAGGPRGPKGVSYPKPQTSNLKPRSPLPPLTSPQPIKPLHMCSNVGKRLEVPNAYSRAQRVMW